jgi:ankyrin repeat protein
MKRPTAKETLQAAQKAEMGELKRLQGLGADWNAAYRGYRPLHALIQERPHGETQESAARLAALRWLLGHGADPEQLGAWPPARAILVAAFGGRAQMVELLRAEGARVDGFVYAALGDRKRVREALRRDAGFATARDQGHLTALQCCAASRLGPKPCEIAADLVEAGADLHALTRSWSHEIDAMYLAINAHNLSLVEWLLERGANATQALTSAAWQRDLQAAEMVWRFGPQVDQAKSAGLPLLNDLIRWGQIPQAQWLLEKGASPNVRDERGWTALHQAVSRGNERLVKAVLAAGADRQAADHEGVTPRELARVMRRLKLVPLLG